MHETWKFMFAVLVLHVVLFTGAEHINLRPFSSGTDGRRVIGSLLGAQVGSSAVANAGDFNNDNIPDHSPGVTLNSAAFLILGETSPSQVDLVSFTSGNVGAAIDDQAGASVGAYPTSVPMVHPTAPTIQPTTAPSPFLLPVLPILNPTSPTIRPDPGPEGPTVESTVAPRPFLESLLPILVPQPPTFKPSPIPARVESPTLAHLRTLASIPKLDSAVVKHYTVVCTVQHVISCPARAYELQQAAMDLTIQYAVASCVDGVSPEQVTAISMVAAQNTVPAAVGPSSHSLRGGAAGQAGHPPVAKAATPPQPPELCLLAYQVASYDHHATAEALMAQLTDAATTGKLEEALRHYALIYQVQPLVNATLGAPVLLDHTADPPSTSELSAAHLAGIAAGGALGLFLILYSASTVMREKRFIKVWPYIEDCDSEMGSVASTEPDGSEWEVEAEGGGVETKEGLDEEEGGRRQARPLSRSFMQVTESEPEIHATFADVFTATP